MIIKKITLRLGNIIEILICSMDIFAKNKTRDTVHDRLLLIRPDAIGDYVLFRNFLEIIRKSEKFNKYHITLLGNRICRNLAEHLDIKYVDEFLWVDIKKLWKNPVYRIKIINQLNSKGYEFIFNTVFSRRYYVDKLVHAVSASSKVGVDGDLRNMLFLQKMLGDKFYDQLIKIPATVFEFDRNKQIIGEFIGEKVEIKIPEIRLTPLHERNNGKGYVVLFPEASAPYKVWDYRKFSETADHIVKNYGYEVVLAGTDNILAEKIMDHSGSGNIRSYAGKTNLTELTALISKAVLLITNDTVAVHIGVALSVKVICVFNGMHFGNFVPYPEGVYDELKVVCPKKGHNINAVEVTEVTDMIKKMLTVS